ncbi:LacI family DNA-binding transcriptional regulator [Vibrio sonorensis]|uniref:LacI family DNA-binding transcriptional regulator n=1 Tax=Vibrio sonorensis TaxID=1004316 RepID=UPI0008D8DDE2|nr:LacI family DNA-binding transcriptional regulator [Vibrio sonorensis]
MARIKDVAALAGVNRSTVSRIINGEGKFREETKRKVEQAMAELNYRPSAIARSLATSSTNMVGLMVTYYTGGFFGEMMEQVQAELDLHKQFLITAQGHRSKEGEKEAIERFSDLRCDGYVLHSRYLSDEDLIELAKLPTPFVLLDRHVEGLEDRCITFNHRQASTMMVNHLIEQGHKKIACISGPSHRHNSLQRRLGYFDAMFNHGLTVDESWCEEGDYGYQSGFKAMEALLERHPDLTAVFSCSEEMTVGAVHHLHEHNYQVPEQVSVVSFDSVDQCASLYPMVSAVHFPISEMAKAAVQVLGHLVDETSGEVKRQFEGQLILRKADAPINQ